ncbi:nuclear cap-binding protein subunit 1, partial [Plakobranchus ocellatus]
VGRELFEKKEVELNNMLVTIDNYLRKRQKIHLPALRVWTTDGPHLQEEYLDCLWAQIKNLRSNKWIEKQIIRPYLAFDSVLCDALQHTLPQIIPPSHNKSISYPLPRVVFRLFDYTDVPQGDVLPGSHAIERYLIEEQLDRIIHTNHFERKDCLFIETIGNQSETEVTSDRFWYHRMQSEAATMMSRHVDQLQQEVDNAHDKQEAAKRKEQDGLDVLDDDVPTDEAIERMEERLERFIIVLTEHLARCESAGVDYNTPWYKWHHELVFRYINTLEQLLFTSDIDIHILEVFQQFCALRS